MVTTLTNSLTFLGATQNLAGPPNRKVVWLANSSLSRKRGPNCWLRVLVKDFGLAILDFRLAILDFWIDCYGDVSVTNDTYEELRTS